MNQDIPEIRRDYLCIVNNDRVDLAAVISSCLYQKSSYPLLFAFPYIHVPKGTPVENEISTANISRIRGSEFCVHIQNVIAKIGKWPTFILAGLDENQLSYLDFLYDHEVVLIDHPSDVENQLTELIKERGFLFCNEFEIDRGLYLAAHSDCILKIRSDVPSLPDLPHSQDGLVLIERNGTASTILGVNYALSIDAKIALVHPPKISQEEIETLLKLWKEEQNDQYLRDLGASIFDQIDGIDFAKLSYATFFTSGTPYSLLLKNVIPFTHVNIETQPDFFLFNAIYRERSRVVGSSLVFSPLEFGVDDEITFVESLLQSNNYYVRSLVGEEATAFELSNHIREFPFEILHICSHGGEIHGVRLSLGFQDRKGEIHVVEYDQVLTFEASSGEEEIGVLSLWFPRKLNGLNWKSQALKNKGYPKYVTEDMWTAIQSNDKSAIKRLEEGHPIIAGSSAIKCIDFNFAAHFNQLASNECNPFVFNNTCWSWHKISTDFLATGGIGYIGTLWSVNNDVAVRIAETFYENLFGGTILSALQIAMRHAYGTNDEHNYAFWGLHFSRLRPAISIAESRMTIAGKVGFGAVLLAQKMMEESDAQALKKSQRQFRWYAKTLENHFLEEVERIARNETI